MGFTNGAPTCAISALLLINSTLLKKFYHEISFTSRLCLKPLLSSHPDSVTFRWLKDMTTPSISLCKLPSMFFMSSSLLISFRRKQMLKDGNSLHFEYCFDILEAIFLSRSICPDNTTLHIKTASRTKVTSLPKCLSISAIFMEFLPAAAKLRRRYSNCLFSS